MQKTTLIVISVISSLIIGYALGNIFPFGNFSSWISGGTETSQGTDIPKDKGRLVVIVKNTDDEPIIGIEIDVAVQPGPPEEWGVKEADNQGKVVYDLDPGSYYVFFNTNRFPEDYVVQPEKKVTVTVGEQEEVTFTLEKK